MDAEATPDTIEKDSVENHSLGVNNRMSIEDIVQNRSLDDSVENVNEKIQDTRSQLPNGKSPLYQSTSLYLNNVFIFIDDDNTSMDAITTSDTNETVDPGPVEMQEQVITELVVQNGSICNLGR